jgi:hypothetical protein
MGREARASQDVKIINTRLGDLFGRDVVNGLPIHRITDATGVVEKRRGNYAVHTEGGIFLRDEYNLVKEVLKYPEYQNRYVFEMLIDLPSDTKNELVTAEQRDYECFYVFQDAQGKALPVVWKAVEVIMHFKLYGKREKLSDASLEANRIEEDAKYIKYCEERMQEATSIVDPVNNSGVKGIFVPSNYAVKRYGNGRLQDDSQVTKPIEALL